MRKHAFLALLWTAPLSLAGCANRQIVRAAPPSVSTPPPEDRVPMPQPEAPPPVNASEEPAPEVASPAPPPAPVRLPVAPRRPAAPETAEPTQPKPELPQISPQLSPRDLEAAKKNTTTNIASAENNLQFASGRRLSPAQKDLVDKISTFLVQAHEAIRTDDWIRAQNLAEKARVLSSELVKSF